MSNGLPWAAAGYGICVFPEDGEPTCKMLTNLPPAVLTDLDTAAGIAQSIYKGGGYRKVIVDRWDAGHIVQPEVFVMPV